MTNAAAVEALFFAALEKGTAAERAAYLDSACGSDAELRRQVEKLLNAHPRVGNFLKKPAVEQLACAPEPSVATEALVSTAGQDAVPARRNGPSQARTEGGRSGDDQIALDFFLPPLERLGDYRIIREIGHGGMGVVYEAEQVSLGRLVALKVLPQKRLADTQTKRRFEREARAAAKLHHTNIVPVFGVGEHKGLPYYVMQFIRGLGLDEVLVELRRLQPGNPGGGGTPGLTGDELRVWRKDVSAASVARSLMIGRFGQAIQKEDDAPADRGAATAAAAPGAAADAVPPVGTPVGG